LWIPSDPCLKTDGGGSALQFVQRLALHLTSWQATFLVGEYLDSEQEDKPIFTVADGVAWLSPKYLAEMLRPLGSMAMTWPNNSLP
jgi:hypothetical protein